MPAAQPCPTAELRVPGVSPAGGQGPGAISSNTLQLQSTESRRLQGSAFCVRVNRDRSILPKTTRPVNTEACLKSIFPQHCAVLSPRDGKAMGGSLG